MLVIGLLAGFVGGFVTGQRMTPASSPVQAADVPRAAQPSAPQSPATQTAAPQPPTPVDESPVVELPQNSPNRTATSEPAPSQASESAPPRPSAPHRREPPNRHPRDRHSSRLHRELPNRHPRGVLSRRPRVRKRLLHLHKLLDRSHKTSRRCWSSCHGPLGATVYVDEVRVGVTPVTVNDVMPGTRLIRMELLGHQTWRTSVNVEAGAFMRIGASIE